MSRRVLAIFLAALPVAAQADDMSTDMHAGHHHAADNPHIRLASAHAVTPADETRYHALEDTIRRDLARYRDVEVAKADGYEEFMPALRQREYHFTRKRNGFAAAAFGFDPLRPTSLLYRKEPGGGYTLTGVMYTAPASADEAELDARVPLSMAQWHQHVNLCVPGPWHRERWTETRNGKPLFGPQSPIVTQDACDAVGGKFVPRLFGWMVHVEAFEHG